MFRATQTQAAKATQSTEPTNYAHVALGAKVVAYAFNVLSIVAVTAIACACSSAIVSALIAVIGAIIVALFGEIAAMVVVAPIPPKALAAVGSASESVMFKLGSLFARKGAAA